MKEYHCDDIDDNYEDIYEVDSDDDVIFEEDDEYVPSYMLDSISGPDLRFEEAARIVVQYQIGSVSLLQRKMNVGYTHACRLLNQLEKAGIVGSQEGNRVRRVLISDLDDLERLFNNQDHFSHLSNSTNSPDALDNTDLSPCSLDPLFEEAARMVVLYQQGSATLLQRKLNVGYARACRILNQLEKAGVVGPQDGIKARRVYISDLKSLEGVSIGSPFVAIEQDFDSIIPEQMEAPPVTIPVSAAKQTTTISQEIGRTNEKDTSTSEKPEYAESVQAMNGCLKSVGEIFLYAYLIVLTMCMAPLIILVLLLWWIIAWILGLIYPGKEFFPIRKVWERTRKWTNNKLHIDLEKVFGGAVLALLISSFLGLLGNLFSRDK